jgi:hypothetical protein
MDDKIQKLTQLNELHKSGAISNEEFERLKSDLLNNEILNTNTTVKSGFKSKKFNLIAFHDGEGKLVSPPDIGYIDIDNMFENQISLLRPFLQKKQTFSPASMTQDEINLANKLFTAADILKFDSERPGFNYPFPVISSIIASAGALYLLYASPCFIILGAGTSVLASVIISFFVLGKMDATKLDRTFSTISLILCALAVYFYFNGGGR